MKKVTVWTVLEIEEGSGEREEWAFLLCFLTDLSPHLILVGTVFKSLQERLLKGFRVQESNVHTDARFCEPDGRPRSAVDFGFASRLCYLLSETLGCLCLFTCNKRTLKPGSVQQGVCSLFLILLAFFFPNIQHFARILEIWSEKCLRWLIPQLYFLGVDAGLSVVTLPELESGFPAPHMYQLLLSH